MRLYWAFTAAACCCVLDTGCKDEQSGDTGTTLANLSAGARRALCEELQEDAMRTWNGDCTQEGLESAQAGGASCETTRAACLRDTVGDCASAEDDGLPSCASALVSDVRACWRATAELNERMFGRDVSCTTGLTGDSSTEPGLPAPCEAVEAKCSGDRTATDPMGGASTPADGRLEASDSNNAITADGRQVILTCKARFRVAAGLDLGEQGPIMYISTVIRSESRPLLTEKTLAAFSAAPESFNHTLAEKITAFVAEHSPDKPLYEDITCSCSVALNER